MYIATQNRFKKYSEREFVCTDENIIMKLSMHIIEHWIQRYHPVSTIVSNDLTIAGIRLFSYEKTPDRNYLDIGRTSDFVKRSQVQEVLLVHRKDVISLRTQELEDVFDTIMDAFVFYQQWEKNMLSAFRTDNPEQTIIDACADIFGPMFFTDNSLQITAFSRQYPKGSVNKNWDDFWDLGALSVDSLVHMQNGTYLEKLPQKWNCEIFYEKYADHYPYSMMISQENVEHELTGQLVIISQTSFEIYQKHLAFILKQALCLIAGHEKKTIQGSIIQNLFRDFLMGKRLDSTGFETFIRIKGWKPDQLCIVALLKKQPVFWKTSGYHLQALCAYFPELIFCESPDSAKDEIVCCIPVSETSTDFSDNRNQTVFPPSFLYIVSKLNFRCFCSYSFSGITHIYIQYLQARSASDRNVENYYFCALSDLVSLHKSNEVRCHAIHPALAKIQLYDQIHHTDFYHILYIYLECERDRVLTAQKLFVHKNTLVYRLKKITTLFCLDLDSVYEREYLMVSYLCAKQ